MKEKNTRNNQWPKVVQTYNPSTQEAKTETLKIKISLSYIRLFSKYLKLPGGGGKRL